MLGLILAAGSNDRINGIVPPFHKPLIVRGRETLVGQAMRIATKHCARTLVVAAPANVAAICSIVQDDSITVVVQQSATGPEDAIRICEPWTQIDRHLLLLMGDNYIPSDDERMITDALQIRSRFVTSVVSSDERLTDVGDGQRWCGPVLVNASDLIDAMDDRTLGSAVASLDLPRLRANVQDLGVPERLP